MTRTIAILLALGLLPAPAAGQQCVLPTIALTGFPAACTGWIVSVDSMRQANLCAEVDLPRAVSQAQAWEQLAQARTEVPAPPPWYKLPEVWAIFGFAAGAAATVTIVRALR